MAMHRLDDDTARAETETAPPVSASAPDRGASAPSAHAPPLPELVLLAPPPQPDDDRALGLLLGAAITDRQGPDTGRDATETDALSFWNPTPPLPVRLDVDAVAASLVAPAADAAGFAPRRISPAAPLDAAALAHAPVLVADVTLADPATLHALGLRHALRPGGTLLIHAESARPPDSLTGTPAFAYPTDTSPDNALTPPKGPALDAVRERLAERLRAIAADLPTPLTDSPFHRLDPPATETRATAEPLALWRVTAAPRAEIGLATGPLDSQRGIDGWTNLETAFFHMDAPFAPSISGRIRRLGRPGALLGPTASDPIQRDLDAQARRIPLPAPLHTVIDTGPGALRGSHGVTRIFHLAAVSVGADGVRGTSPNLHQAVRDLVQAVAAHNHGLLTRLRLRRAPVRSLLIPILAKPSGRAARGSVASQSIAGAIAALETLGEGGRRPSVQRLVFLAETDADAHAYAMALAHFERAGALTRTPAEDTV